MKDQFEESYGILKYNENGRYINFIAIQGENRSIIITPEFLNKGEWSNIAHKIDDCVYELTSLTEHQRFKGRKANMSYKEAVCNSRWIVETMEEKETQTKEDHSTVTKVTLVGKSDLLTRWLVGRF